ncbi:hypothetical protein [Pseudomonas nicosulfuronedens]
MKLKLVALPALLAVLAGCEQPGFSGMRPAANNRVGVPALSLVQEAVRSLAPTFSGKRIPLLENQLCALAQGQITAAQNAAQLAKLGVDASRLPRRSTDALALLVNGDRAGQLTACAAAQANAAFLLPNPAELMRTVSVAPTDAKTDAKADAKAKPAEARREIDQQAVNQMLSVKLSQGRANAEVFAVIASRLSALPGLSEADYRARAQAMFGELAPAYLTRQQQLRPAAGTHFQLDQLDANQLAFRTDTGFRYQLSSSDGLSLRNYGQLWYGKGLLLGANYRLQVDNLLQVGKVDEVR